MTQSHIKPTTVITIINNLTSTIGKTSAWLIVLMTLVCTLIVVVRAVFNLGTVGVQESLTYMHALIIMLTSAYTLKEDGHVRVDIFYRSFSPVKKAWVDALGGALFLLPLGVFTALISWDYVASSWAVLEGSSDTGGIPGVFLLKSLLLINGVLLTLQALAETLRNIVVLTFSDSFLSSH